MGLPADAGTVFSDGDPLPANEINTIKDCIAAGSHGERKLLIPASAAVPIEGSSATYSGGTQMWVGASGSAVHVPIPLRVGDRLKSVKVYGQEGSSGTEHYDVSLFEADATTSATTTRIAIKKESGTTGAMTSVELSSADAGSTPLPYTLLAAKAYFLEIAIPANTGLKSVEITYDCP